MKRIFKKKRGGGEHEQTKWVILSVSQVSVSKETKAQS